MSWRGRGRGGYRNQNDFSNRITPTVTVEIRNWEGGTKDDLIGFILKKTSIKLQNVVVNGPVITANVNPDQSSVLKAYSGYRFAQNTLRIDIIGDGSQQSPSTSNTIEILRNFLQSRYNPQLKMLDLQRLQSDSFLQQNGLFASASTASKMFPALMKIATESNNFEVESVNLAANNLEDVAGVTTLAPSYPNLKNLSLADNNIAYIKGLESWRNKFRYLRELILAGNPITNQLNYKDEIMKLFPRLVMLDGQIIRDESTIDRLKLPLPVKQMFFENNDIQNIATNFLTNFFNLFDTNRDQLLQLYDDLSTFSISVNSSSPRVLIPSRAPGGWSSYIPLSRNLQKITTESARINRLYIGQQAIQNTFSRIPKTKHDLITSPQKFSVESWRTTGVRSNNDTGIIISIHGEFNEVNDPKYELIRSFDRTFIVIESANGGMIVASDIMTVRAWSGFDAWKETTSPQPSLPINPPPAPTINPSNPTIVPPIITSTPATPPPNGSIPNNIPPELSNLQPQQLAIVQKLMQETRLSPQYSRMLAEQANFDLNQAAVLFQQSHQQLPPNAFI